MGFALPSGVVNTDSAYFYADSAFKFGPLVKDLGDQTLIVVDYSLLTPTHVVNGFMFTLDVTSNPALVVAYPALNSTKSVLTFLVSGGIAGQSYALSIHTVLDINSRIDVLTINIPSSGGECERINPVPELYTQLPLGDPTQAYVNTGVRYFWGRVPPANPNVMDQWYSPDTQTLSEYVTDGKTYRWQTFMDAGLVEEAPLGNILYSRFNGYWVANPIQADALGDGRMYARQNNLWVQIPTIIADAPSNGTRYIRYNNSWQPDPIQTDVPNDGQSYVRNNTGWINMTSAAGVPEAPNDGKLYGRGALSWSPAYSVTNPAGYQTAAQVTASLVPYALISSVPVGSNAVPFMNGVGASGGATAFSRGDHVHPTDTSLYPVGNPANYQTDAQVATYVANAIANAHIDCGEI